MSFEPNIVAFLCKWCSSAGADLAGVSRLEYKSNVIPIQVKCSGRVNPLYILKALKEGALYAFDVNIIGGTTITYDINIPETQNLFITLQKSTLVSYGNSWLGQLSLLRGAENIASDRDSHDLILHIIDPEPGTYTVKVTANVTGSGILAVWTSLPELPLGKWVVGKIYCSYM